MKITSKKSPKTEIISEVVNEEVINEIINEEVINEELTEQLLMEEFKLEEEVPVVMNEIIESVTEHLVDQLINQINETANMNNVIINQNVVITKASLARGIFEEELKNGLVRKDTINRLMGEANLTKAGAATYFQNMKKKAGLVVSRV